MILIGVFVLCLLVAAPAQAIPVAAVTAVLGVTAFWATAITVALNVVLATAISFVSSMLLRPPKPAQNAGYAEGGSAQRVENKITVREAAAVRNIIYGRRRVAGKIVFAQVTDENRFLHMVVVFAGHEIDAFEELYLNDRQVLIDGNGMVTTGEFTGLARLKLHLGTATQGADGTLINETRGAWETSDRLLGCAYIYARFEFEPAPTNPTFGGKVYQAGVPNLTATIRGKKVFDPTTDTTYWTGNSALCLADYLADPIYGIGITYADIDETALIAAAAACEEVVSLAQGGTETRYHTDGELLSSAEPAENIGLLLGAMQGRLHYDGDKWLIRAGVYIAPTVDLSDDDLRAGPTISCILSRRDLFNSVKGTFVDRANNYIRSDFPARSSASYVAADGEQLWRDIDLPLTTSASRAQRIAKIEMQRSRQQIPGTMPCKLSAWRVQAGDTIRWTSSRYGWSLKPFEVRKATFAVAEDGTLGVDLEIEETVSTIYDWLSSEQEAADLAPDTLFPTATEPKPPSNLRVTESLYSARDGGGVKARVRLDWDASPDAFVYSGGRYEAFYRASGATTWTMLATTDAAIRFAEWSDAVPGVYDFAVRAVNFRGVPSSLLIVRQSISGLSAAPSAPRNFAVAAMGNTLALATWDPSTELDVTQGGKLVVRHSPLLAGAAWSDGITIGQQAYPAAPGVAFLPLKSGTYLAKFKDSTGQWSEAVSFVQRQHSVLEFATLTGGSLDEAPAFAGSKVNCAVDPDGDLVIVGRDTFSEVPLVSELTSWSFPGGVITDEPMVLGYRRSMVLGDPGAGRVLGDPATGLVLGRVGSPARMVLGDPASGIVLGRPRQPSAWYDWSTPIDLGSVKRCRLTIEAQTVVEDVFDDFASRSGNVSSWASWSGAIEGAEADAWTVVQTTDDDPASGGATWTDWQRIDSAEFEVRGFRLRTYLNSKDAATNIRIMELSATVEGVV